MRSGIAGFGLALVVTCALAPSIWHATALDLNHDQLQQAAYVQKLLHPDLYTRDALLHDERQFAFYTPSWVALLRLTIAWLGDALVAFRVLAILLIFGSTLSWFALLRGVCGSTMAAMLGALGTVATRDIPYETWGVGALGYAIPRSLGHIAVPLVMLWALRVADSPSTRRLAGLGFVAGLLVNLHPPLAVPCFAGLALMLACGQAVGPASCAGPASPPGPASRRSERIRRSGMPLALMAASFAVGALPFAWTYLVNADTSSHPDLPLGAIYADYFGFLRPLSWFSRIGNWKVWAFDWMGPVALAAWGVRVATRTDADRTRAMRLVRFAIGVLGYVVVGLVADEALRRAGMAPADPEFVRGLRLLALPVFALAMFAVRDGMTRRGGARLGALSLAALLLLAPPVPLRTAWYATRHGVADTTVADRARRDSLRRTAEWAQRSTPVDALFCVALVPWEDAVLFRFASLRSTTPLGTDAHALVSSNVRAFVGSHAFLMQTRRAVAARNPGAVEGLAQSARADYLVVASSGFRWFRTDMPMAFTDGTTTIYAVSSRPR